MTLGFEGITEQDEGPRCQACGTTTLLDAELGVFRCYLASCEKGVADIRDRRIAMGRAQLNCQITTCGAAVFNRHHCAAGHIQLRG
jgi:hypothetical protein